MRNAIDQTGLRYSRLTVIKRGANSNTGLVRWECLCDCGNTTLVTSASLKRGNTTSCGCRRKEGLHRTHNMGHTKTYINWSQMIQRCTNPNNEKWASYGGRGITVCERWMKFENFVADMGERPGDNYSIDRIDNSIGYSPENCRWATPKQQANNTRRNRLITYNGVTKNLTDWAAERGIKRETISDRLGTGWTVGQALGFEFRKPYHTGDGRRSRRKNLTQHS